MASLILIVTALVISFLYFINEKYEPAIYVILLSILLELEHIAYLIRKWTSR